METEINKERGVLVRLPSDRFMIDIHTHILPDIDDGAESVSESLVMLADSYSQGVRLCVATPHCVLHGPEDLPRFLAKRQKSYDALREAQKAQPGAYPEVLLGAEIYLDHDVSEEAELEKLCIEGTNILLIEFSYDLQEKRTSEWIYALLARKIRPMIAHVDRYSDWQLFLEEFAGSQVIFQIGNDAFFSMSGRRLLKKIFLYDGNFVAASDMHHCNIRGCNMGKAFRKAGKAFPGMAGQLFYENSRRFLGR